MYSSPLFKSRALSQIRPLPLSHYLLNTTMSVSQSENGTKSRETSEVFDNKTIAPQPRRGAIANDDATKRVSVKEEQSLEKGGDGHAGDLSDKLPVRAKEELLKDVSSQSQEASVTPSAPEPPSAFNQFPTGDVEPTGIRVKFPPTVGGGAKGKGKG
ncbi:hypothetical protein BT93_J0515 [Corymbia citriodora subsp. variegata]|nr:hypothetical protein BT93_J0515 [Corymbia citriodora subsp. variegata]